MGLLECCEGLFGTSNLYQVLGVEKEASEAEIRRGYYKVSLQVHPDRVPDNEQATEKFQVLGKVYAVLSDKEQRAVYDEQGIVDEESDTLRQDRSWDEYWRLLFPKITVDDIKAFEAKYKGSEEEASDVRKSYMDHKGNMDRIMVSVLCCTYEEEPRIREIIEKAITAGELPAFDAFTNEPEKKKAARKRQANREKREAEKMTKDMGLADDEDSLKALIQKRQKSREQETDSFLADLEAKYCKKGGKGRAGKKGKK